MRTFWYTNSMKSERYHGILLVIFLAVLVWSAYRPYEYFTWLLEVFPAIIGVIVLLATRKKFQFTNMVYTLVLFHAIILMIGGHYTYARMPLFDWLRDALVLNRNYYDRLGHIVQGFVPAMIARELFIRLVVIKGRGWMNFIIVTVCTFVAVMYEFLEWWVAVIAGSAAVSFLATQGDVWDPQWDMFLAIIGAVVALATLSKWHDRQLRAKK